MKNIDLCLWLYCSLFLGTSIKVNKNIKKKRKNQQQGLTVQQQMAMKRPLLASLQLAWSNCTSDLHYYNGVIFMEAKIG